MPRHCPICDRLGRLPADVSKECRVEYYRCDVCGYAWSYSKPDPNAQAIAVTRTSVVAAPDTP